MGQAKSARGMSIYDKHVVKIARKHEALEGKKALLEMWEAKPDQAGHDYILALRAKLRSAENQLAAMTI